MCLGGHGGKGWSGSPGHTSLKAQPEPEHLALIPLQGCFCFEQNCDVHRIHLRHLQSCLFMPFLTFAFPASSPEKYPVPYLMPSLIKNLKCIHTKVKITEDGKNQLRISGILAL